MCLSVQVGAGDLDGFQADTEEEEDDDGDCVIMDISEAGGEETPPSQGCERTGRDPHPSRATSVLPRPKDASTALTAAGYGMGSTNPKRMS